MLGIKIFCDFKNVLSYKLGSLGCLLSHMKIYNHCINNDISYALILEDDILIKEIFYQNKVNEDVKKYIQDDNFVVILSFSYFSIFLSVTLISLH